MRSKSGFRRTDSEPFKCTIPIAELVTQQLESRSCFSQPQLPRPPLHRLNAKADVRTQINTMPGTVTPGLFAAKTRVASAYPVS